MSRPEVESPRQEFEHLLSQSLKNRMNLEGQVVKGRVVSMDKDMALIDVNLKSEGRVSLKEFSHKLEVGDMVDVYIDRYEGPMGDAQLSHTRARQEAAWLHLSESFRNKKPVEGRIFAITKGGAKVDISGTEAFLPGSQVDIRPVRNLSSFLNSVHRFIVLKMDESRNNVVVSRRMVLEEERAAGREHLLATLEQEQILDGVVKNLTDYGAFVDLGGIDGLLHITDISWQRIKHPSEVLTEGQAIKVMVTRFNKENQRISLGMKQLENDPWSKIHESYAVGDKIEGVVSKVTDYGAFVSLPDGLEGLIHKADMVWCKKNLDTESVVKADQNVQVMILDIDTTRRRLGLGLKQCQQNPLEKFSQLYPVGSEVQGQIEDVTEFGLLVQLPEGVDGTVHSADLSWDNDEDALSNYHPGSMVKLKVLNVNVEKEMISLGIKQLTEDPLAEPLSQFQQGQTLKVIVCGINENGIEVDLGGFVRSFIPRSEISNIKNQQNPSQFSVGQEVEAKLVSVNPQARKFNLSIRSLEMEEEKAAMAEYSGNESRSKLGRLLEEALERNES